MPKTPLRLVEFLPARPDRLWALSRQVGVTGAIVKCAPELTGLAPPSDRDALALVVRRFQESGLDVVGLEGDQFDMSRIKLGMAGRDDDLEQYARMLKNLSEFGITLLCYNFMAGIGWHRSGTTPGRGGALATHFKLSDVPSEFTPAGEVSEERMWENYTYFLRAMLPVAEKCGVRLALHPDDPPLSPLRGIARIFSTPAAFDRAYDVYPSRCNAVTFCQANFKLMNVDLAALAKHLHDRIAFIHVRDVRGSADDFVELFHDEMEVDQASLFRLYDEVNLGVPVRCDHVPTMAGEENDPDTIPGYGTLGRLFAIGYFKGLLQAQRIPYL